MKTKILANIAITLLLTTLIPALSAQQQPGKGQVDVAVRELEQRGDSLYITLDFDLSRLSLHSRRSLTLVPTLETTASQQQLPEIIINGPNRNRAYIRQNALLPKAKRPTPYTVVVATPKGKKQIEYRYAIPFRPWMDNARLDLIEELCGCAGYDQQVAIIPLAPQIQTDAMYPYLAYIQPETEAIKHRNVQKECYLDFVVGRTDIDPTLGNNQYELNKIDHTTAEIKNDPNIKITGFSIIGYASPEGTLARNKELSEKRAKALQQYIAPRIPLSNNRYQVEFGGEDWSGLVQLVEASTMAGKQQVLEIIRNRPVLQGRETRLMELDGGNPYRYMLKQMFPQLRRALCRVDFDVREFSVQEAKVIIYQRPQQLSLHEMYRVANTYPKGSPEFNQVFEIAVSLFPDDDTANLNAANAALSRRDTPSAEKHLKQISRQTPEYNNSMGALHLLKKEYPQAAAYLKKAQEAGVKEATMNLQQLQKRTRQ